MLKRTCRRSRDLVVVLLASVLVLSVSAACQAQTESIVAIQGRVTDDAGKAVLNAVVKAVGTDVSAVLTDADGRY